MVAERVFVLWSLKVPDNAMCAPTRACIKQVTEENHLPDTALGQLGKTLDQPCIAPYVALSNDAAETAWAAADVQVTACYDHANQPVPARSRSQLLVSGVIR